ncbi:MAG: phosphoribosylformylglycinamidine synthase II [Bdellovibrionales bacterium RIFCSPHIGHO2_01_FULL_40_29]|nr:MAG: phosphoribosylformylglycinamidine synthase II [Bdellovibrionales bacterium RIFCSPHIGHO2_01_FULL_40_29]
MSSDLSQNLKIYRLSMEEYEKMKTLLGHEPNVIEWCLFSALWSEHCSYKSSKNHLRKFSFRNSNTPDMDGENAGVVDLGYGEKIAFKMESHNHPSFIEPVQGAATGVGGILRDIFTMGARPIMSANYLCFGDIEAPRMKHLMKGVVKGISSYGNCVGVPTVTGQTNFHPLYNKNILVNALSVGYFGPEQRMALSNASGSGNLVVYVGAKTGRDGVHGASMASASFDDDSESKKPNVQIGDPFYEKLLIEACLEVLEKNLVVAMQDMGAAGLTSSSFEMSSKGQVGFILDLKKVPLRDSSMTPEDILLSESQERMLLICKPEKLSELQETFKKWSLDSAVLGEVQSDRKVKLMWGEEVLTNIDPDLIVEEAPRYDRPYQPWNSLQKTQALQAPEKINFQSLIEKAFKTSKLNRFQWIYNQYDQRVGARTATACESAVAHARLDHSGRGLALAVGCRTDLMVMDAQIGAFDAVYYPAFQMALKGSVALSITDCLNFGNPQKPEIMSQFVASVEAIASASVQLNAPVISGNVSFYNETLDENIPPTPAIGMVGMRDSVEDILPDYFQAPMEYIVRVKMDWLQSYTWLNSLEQKVSQFTENTHADIAGFIKQCQALDQKRQAELIPITSIKAIGLGGLAVTCLKMVQGNVGFDLSFDTSLIPESELFRDELYSFIVTTTDLDLTISFLKKHFKNFPVDIRKVGETVTEKIHISKKIILDFKTTKSQFEKGL